MEKTVWKNRIIATGEKPAKDFKANPSNWRTHPDFQRRALSGILSEVGWVTGVIENVTTGNVIDGHARIEEAIAKNESEPIPFIQVELSEEEEQKVLAVLDPIGALAGCDEDRLSELSRVLKFESDALSELMAQREITEINPGDFFEQQPSGGLPENFIIELEFETASDHAAVLEKLTEISVSPAQAVKSLLNL